MSINFLWQPILKRDYAIFGNELVTKIDESNDVQGENSRISLSDDQQQILNSEALTKLQLMSMHLKKSNSFSLAFPPKRKFIKIEQSSLLNFGLVVELNQAGETLSANNQKLVIELTNQNHKKCKIDQENKIIRHVYMLKDHDIEIALNHYDSHEYSLNDYISFDLYDYIKLDIQKAGIYSPSDGQINSFNDIYDIISSAIYEKKVQFIAECVDTALHNELVRNLPFDLFQGLYLSPPEEIGRV